MRRFLALVLSLVFVMALAACGGEERLPSMEPKSGQSPASEPESAASQPQADEPPVDPEEELRNIAADFALNFNEPFSSPEELNVDRFCLLKIYYEDPEAVGEDGFLWVSPERLAAEVELRFGIPDYQFRSPEQENVYPRYVEEKGAIAFAPAGHGLWFEAALVDLESEGEYQYYTFDIYNAMITDGHEEPTLERTLVYKFRVTETADGAPFLQAVSAEAVGQEESSDPDMIPDVGNEWDPDPGTGYEDPNPDETERQRQLIDAMVAYLEGNLDPWDYTAIWSANGPDGAVVQIVTPNQEAAKKVMEAYTGETVLVEYLNEQFSKGQLDQAKADLEQFLADHPEIQVWDWRAILLFGGYEINLKEKSDALTKFIEDYPIQGIYVANVYAEEPMHPD